MQVLYSSRSSRAHEAWFWSSVPPDMRDAVAKAYLADFDMFDYSPEQYFEDLEEMMREVKGERVQLSC